MRAGEAEKVPFSSGSAFSWTDKLKPQKDESWVQSDSECACAKNKKKYDQVVRASYLNGCYRL